MSKIITFYSYKGGVGRSMALANIAFELSRRKKRVLMIDWDLEAPGLEKYFNNFKINKTGDGLLPLLLDIQQGKSLIYNTYLWTIFPPSQFPIDLLQSGRDKDPDQYSINLGNFNWDKFFQENQGGVYLEKLREQWLKNYDVVLIDSRTGLSDSSGICTIMMPDVLVPMFTANYQSLFGVRDIVNYINSARKKLAYERMGLVILPIPARFGTRIEFKESQEWLDRIADILKDYFNLWLPKWIEPRFIIEQIKIPQIDYFSFGEKLAVLEQSSNDPESLGYIYSRIAALLSSDFTDIRSFVGSDYFDLKKNEFESIQELDKSVGEIQVGFDYDVYISYPRSAYQWVKEILVPALTEYLTDLLDYTPKLFVDFNEVSAGDSILENVKNALNRSKTLVLIFSGIEPLNSSVNFELHHFIELENTTKLNLIFPLGLDFDLEDINDLPEIIRNRQILNFTKYKSTELIRSTRYMVQFGQEIEDLAKVLVERIKQLPMQIKENKNNSRNRKEKEIKLAISELKKLAQEYEKIRELMPFGNQRTRVMESIVDRMKLIKVDSKYILPEFSRSSSPGERLVAIAFLQKVPNSEYLDWLANHIGDVEKPFVGYQASVALYYATKYYGIDKFNEIEDALNKADISLNSYNYKDPNQLNILEGARRLLKAKFNN